MIVVGALSLLLKVPPCQLHQYNSFFRFDFVILVYKFIVIKRFISQEKYMLAK